MKITNIIIIIYNMTFLKIMNRMNVSNILNINAWMAMAGAVLVFAFSSSNNQSKKQIKLLEDLEEISF